jgi:hypothetical protein
MFPFEWVPAERWRREAAYVTVFQANPGAIRPAVSVQGAWNRCQGIIRGAKESGVLIEDHTWDVLDDHGRLARSEKRIFGASAIRSQVWTGPQHADAYRNAHPDERVVAWTGNGNLLSNPHFVAFDGSSQRSVLYCLASELKHLGKHGRSYTCLVVRKPGYSPIICIERVCFEDGADGPHVYSAKGEEITSEVEFATYGQMLIEDGTVIGDEDLIRMVGNQEFYDLRHLLLFGRVQLGPDRWIDAGLDTFWDAQGNPDTRAVAAAIRGESTSADVGQLPADLVQEAMSRKGYFRVKKPKAAGEYSLESGILKAVLRRGIYPHSMVGTDANGSLIVAAIRGFSNRVGVSVQGAAEIMRMLGARTALMVDNGGDVMMSFEDEMILPSSNGRDRLRSILVYRTTKQPSQLDSSDLRVASYPKQYRIDPVRAGQSEAGEV